MSALYAVTPELKLSTSGCYFYQALDGQNNRFLCSRRIDNNDLTVTIYNDDLTIKKQFTVRIDNLQDEILYEYTIDTKGFIATQKFFNTDSKWEIIIRTEGSPYSYKVVNEDGDVVCDLGEVDDYYAYITPTHNYFITRYHNHEDSQYHYEFYSFTSTAGSGVQSVPTKVSSVAYPNPLSHGRNLTVELSEPAPVGTVVEIHDMNGRKMLQEKVAQGAEKVIVSPRGLIDGTYIYIVRTVEEIIEKGKVIIR